MRLSHKQPFTMLMITTDDLLLCTSGKELPYGPQHVRIPYYDQHYTNDCALLIRNYPIIDYALLVRNYPADHNTCASHKRPYTMQLYAGISRARARPLARTTLYQYLNSLCTTSKELPTHLSLHACKRPFTFEFC